MPNESEPKYLTHTFLVIGVPVTLAVFAGLFAFWQNTAVPLTWDNPAQHEAASYACSALFALTLCTLGLSVALVLKRKLYRQKVSAYLNEMVPAGTNDFLHALFDQQMFPFCWNPLTPLNAVLAFRCFGACYLERATADIRDRVDQLATNLVTDTRPNMASLADQRDDARAIHRALETCFRNGVLKSLVSPIPEGDADTSQLKGLFQQARELASCFVEQVCSQLMKEANTDKQADEIIQAAGAAAADLRTRLGALNGSASAVYKNAIESLMANRRLTHRLHPPCKPEPSTA